MECYICNQKGILQCKNCKQICCETHKSSYFKYCINCVMEVLQCKICGNKNESELGEYCEHCKKRCCKNCIKNRGSGGIGNTCKNCMIYCDNCEEYCFSQRCYQEYCTCCNSCFHNNPATDLIICPICKNKCCKKCNKKFYYKQYHIHICKQCIENNESVRGKQNFY